MKLGLRLPQRLGVDLQYDLVEAVIQQASSRRIARLASDRCRR